MVIEQELRRKFAVELREVWTESGLTQHELATRAGLTQPQISDLFRGRYRTPGWDILSAVAAGLGYDIELSASLVTQNLQAIDAG